MLPLLDRMVCIAAAFYGVALAVVVAVATMAGHFGAGAMLGFLALSSLFLLVLVSGADEEQ